MALEKRFVDQECVDCGTHFMRNILASAQVRCPSCQRKHGLELKREYSKRPDQKAKKAAWKRRQYAQDPEKFRAEVREWKRRNPEKVAECNRRYEAEHRDHINAKQRKYYAEHADQVRAWVQRYRVRNRDEILRRQRAYRMENGDRLNHMARLRRLVRRGDASAKLRLAEAKGLQVYCHRLHLKAYPLPCGRYPSCNHCPSCPKGGVMRSAWGGV